MRAENYPELPPSDIRVPGMDHHLLVFHYKALNGTFRHECAGRKTDTVLRDDDLSFIPAGADNRWQFGGGRPSALHILIPETAFDSITARDLGGGVRTALRDDFQVASAQLAGLARLVRIELDAGSKDLLYVDTLAAALCHQILRQFSRRRPRVQSRMANVAAAYDLIAAESHRTLLLDDLAALCDLSRSQLVRCFRLAYGMAPHQLQTKTRIDRARAAICADRDVPLASLAIDLGFADQSHFSRTFKAETGQTPRAFVASLG